MRIPTTLILALGVLLLQVAARAQSLVTQEEFRAEQHAPPLPAIKALPVAGAPRIDVQAPAQGGSVVAPFEIRLKLVADDGARILPETLRILYGALGLDITSRVLKQAEYKDNVLRIDRANVPVGKHRLIVKVRDSLQREGQLELTLVVVDKAA